MLLSQRYFPFFELFHFIFLWISLAKKHRFPNREKLVNREIETVVLNTINPLNSKKLVTTFSWIFHFSLVDFSEKIYEIFFHQWAMLLGYMKEYMGSKKPKASFWESYRRLQSWPHYIDRTVAGFHCDNNTKLWLHFSSWNFQDSELT